MSDHDFVFVGGLHRSGTTLLAASDLDRNAIGLDLQEHYVSLCKERLAKHGKHTASERRCWRARSPNTTRSVDFARPRRWQTRASSSRVSIQLPASSGAPGDSASMSEAT